MDLSSGTCHAFSPPHLPFTTSDASTAGYHGGQHHVHLADPAMMLLVDDSSHRASFHVQRPQSSLPPRSTVPRQHAQQACESCRTEKEKCDESFPCGRCKEKKSSCFYNERPKAKSMESFIDTMEEVKRGVAQIKNLFERHIPSCPMKTPNNCHVPWLKIDNIDQIEQALIPSEVDELSIPLNHTTAAHHLLQWPKMRCFLDPRCDTNYVLRLEANRSSIRDMCDNINNPPSGLAVKDVGLDEVGRVTATPETLRHYHNVYMRYLYKFHPFLDSSVLQKKMDSFIRSYCPSSGTQVRGTKRQRSNGHAERTRTTRSNVGSNIIERTIDNAIVLLVLALGSICEARSQPVPDPQTKDFHSEYPPASSSCTKRDQKKAAELPDPDDADLRNIAAILGLAFYSYASGILGIFQGANDLGYVQATLLAALYAGQVARPYEFHAWISTAARVCQVWIELGLYKKADSENPNDKRLTLLKVLFWTCLQLESDILAELNLPASGISRYESSIDLPQSRVQMGLGAPDVQTMNYYTQQIRLRKLLNEIHTGLYKEEQGQVVRTLNMGEYKRLNQRLNEWRKNLPEDLRWNTKGPASEDINAARLRAKYYGAGYIIHRPLLYYALHNEDCKLPDQLLKACKVCISCAISSTNAFDRIKGRLVVTNIFGTGHAQFGNMLVLSATYRSKNRDLSNLVEERLLRRLLQRTIAFLLQSGDMSPTLQEDAHILREVYKKIFEKPPAVNPS